MTLARVHIEVCLVPVDGIVPKNISMLQNDSTVGLELYSSEHLDAEDAQTAD